MSYETDFERRTRERLERIEAKLDALAAAIGGQGGFPHAREWADYATNHGGTHPDAIRLLEKAGRAAGTRAERSSGTAR